MNHIWAAITVLLQYRDSTPLKTTTGHTITIWPNTEKAKDFRGQLETEVLTKICKEIYNTVIVQYFKSGNIKITLKD